ncbi:hypothetical protein [Paracnuella aquatica]|uniref:hypothetical protein n=1 Tax=Paracnuella aquatica TaxID=2268757 RepID=UPI000DEF192F|nr:hypothetical protein [Paracnuella aquatica]RPD43822.1 hypothetical protein DRJ53_18725 [Paracnuella aquatica]
MFASALAADAVLAAADTVVVAVCAAADLTSAALCVAALLVARKRAADWTEALVLAFNAERLAACAAEALTEALSAAFVERVRPMPCCAKEEDATNKEANSNTDVCDVFMVFVFGLFVIVDVGLLLRFKSPMYFF